MSCWTRRELCGCARISPQFVPADAGTVPSRRAPTCPLQNRSLAFGGISVPCAALLECAQIRSLSVWIVNTVAFLLSGAIGLITGRAADHGALILSGGKSPESSAMD